MKKETLHRVSFSTHTQSKKLSLSSIFQHTTYFCRFGAAGCSVQKHTHTHAVRGLINDLNSSVKVRILGLGHVLFYQV